MGLGRLWATFEACPIYYRIWNCGKNLSQISLYIWLVLETSPETHLTDCSIIFIHFRKRPILCIILPKNIPHCTVVTFWSDYIKDQQIGWQPKHIKGRQSRLDLTCSSKPFCGHQHQFWKDLVSGQLSFFFTFTVFLWKLILLLANLSFLCHEHFGNKGCGVFKRRVVKSRASF